MRISRRSLLAGALGAVAASATQACLPRAGSSTRITVTQGADPAGLHPLLHTGLVEASVYGNIFDPLVSLDADGQIQPALAESWEARDDHRWVFKLRRGVTFHNQESFDAQSVRFTLQQVLDPGLASPIRAQLDVVERVETPDSHTAVIVTQRPFVPLLAELTGVMMLPPAHTARVGWQALASQPIGTGPFRFVERLKDDHIGLRANELYWRGRPRTETLEFRPTPDTTSRLAAVRTGQADLATNVPGEQVDTLERDGLRVPSRPGIQVLYARLNMRKPPLDDLRVRQAISHAVDIDQLIATVYGGRARRVNGPYQPEVFAYDAGAAVPTYDPERARFLLRTAGLPAGTTLVFETPRGRYPKDDQVVEALAGYLSEVGLQTRIQIVEWAAYLQKLQAGQGEHLFLLAGTNRTFDPHFTLVRLYTNAGSFGRDYYGNPEVDALVAQAAATLDAESRRTLYHRVLSILRADIPALWIAQLDDIYAWQKRLVWEPRADSLLWMYSAHSSA